MISGSKKIRLYLFALWLGVIICSIALFFFEESFVVERFAKIFTSSSILGYAIFLLASSLRGFTLIPVTYFILVGIVFIPAVPLFIMTIIGILISSASLYYFSEYLNFDEYFEKNHKKQIDKITAVITKNELPIVITWSFMPFLPTDLICYVCGTLDIPIRKFLFGILVGEGIASALYIFLGKEVLSLISF
ncbi:MAG: VTT domain-containing protein [Minisyncoccia bacterium]